MMSTYTPSALVLYTRDVRPLLLAVLLLLGPVVASAQTVTVSNSTTLSVDNDAVLDLQGATLDFGDETETSSLNEAGGGRVTGGTLTATRTLNAPSALNVAGLGFTITTTANLGATTVTRAHTIASGVDGIERTYDIAPAQNNSGLDATIVFAYHDDELGSLIETNLLLYYSDDRGASFSEITSTLDASANTLTTTGLDVLARFTAGTDLASLLQLAGTMLLEGPWNDEDMNTALTEDLPTADPYGLGASVASPDFFTTDTNGQLVVDWVYVQLRTGDPTGTMTVESETAALLKKDGSIVSTDGTSEISFEGAESGSYYLVVGHRNHLAIMSASAVDCSSGICTYDFTTAQSQAYGSEPMAEVNSGIWALYAGDASANGQVQNDDKINHWNTQTGSGGYLSADFNLNAEVQNDDKNVYWQPNSGRGTQVPGAGGSSLAAAPAKTSRNAPSALRTVKQ